MKAYQGVELLVVQLHSFLNPALDGDEWSASRPGRFIPVKDKIRYMLYLILNTSGWTPLRLTRKIARGTH